MENILKQEELIVDKAQLLSFFREGKKLKTDLKIGLEIEKPGVNSNTLKAATYSGAKGILALLKKYKQLDNWDYILENESILGLVNGCNSITLEPGSQIELSNCPKKSVHEIYNQVTDYNHITSNIAEDFDIYWLGYGLQPLSTYEDIELIPKKRYDIMTEYLPPKGNMALIMMRETAGIQVSLDYESEEDATNKLRASLGLSPIITAIFANSPIRGGKETGYKSYRSLGWLGTDEVRCGLISRKVFEEGLTFEDYVDIILDLPMIFLKKHDHWINMNGMPFKKYIEEGYQGYKATIDDWNLHKSSFFPNVRLNNYLEIRNCDCQRSDLICTIPAIWKGIFYNNDALEAAWGLVKHLSWEERLQLSELVPKYALDTKTEKINVYDTARELVNIAEYSLKEMVQLNDEGQDETIYLTELKALLAEKQTPADKILDLWHNEWDKDLRKLIEHVRLT